MSTWSVVPSWFSPGVATYIPWNAWPNLTLFLFTVGQEHRGGAQLAVQFFGLLPYAPVELCSPHAPNPNMKYEHLRHVSHGDFLARACQKSSEC